MKKKPVTEITSLAELVLAIAARTYRVMHTPQTKVTKTEREKQLGSIGRHDAAKKFFSGMVSIINAHNVRVIRLKLMDANAKTATLHDYRTVKAEVEYLRGEYHKVQDLFNQTVEALFPAAKGKGWAIRTGWKIVIADVKTIGMLGKQLAFPMSLSSFLEAQGAPPIPGTSSGDDERIVIE